MEPLGVARGAARKQTANAAAVIGNLRHVVGDRTERPLSDRLRSGEVRMEDVTRLITVERVLGAELFVQGGAQVPAVLQIRNDQFRLENTPGVADVAKASRALNGAIRRADTKARLHGKSTGPELPAQFDRYEVGVVSTAEFVGNTWDITERAADACHDKWLHDDGIIGRTEEGPARNEQEALHVD